MEFRLSTNRLNLRPCREDDIPALHHLWTNPEVRRYLWDDQVIPLETVTAVLSASMEAFATYHFGQWVLLEKGKEDIIGFCGLRHIGDTENVEILYALLPAHWGKGYATEAAREVLRFAFEEAGLERVYLETDAPNLSSQKVAERLGAPLAREYLRNGLPTISYVITSSRA